MHSFPYLNHADRLVAKFHVYYMSYPNDSRLYVALRSARYTNWYLTLNKRRLFRGEVPTNGNEIFEMVSLGSSRFALRSVLFSQDSSNTTELSSNNITSSNISFSSGSGSGSGSGDDILCYNNTTVPCTNTSDINSSVPTMPNEQRECYLGFSSLTQPDGDGGKPSCYNSTEQFQTHLVLYDADSK